MTNTRNERGGGTAVLVAATITMGLSAPARGDDRTYVAVMRNIKP
jgi:hypothetical protein